MISYPLNAYLINYINIIILNDLRIFIDISMNILPKIKQSLILTDIILEPLLLTINQFKC